MTIHWQDLDTTGKITAIQTVWREGMSAAQIAAHFNGATRRSVIGMYDRWRDNLAQTPLRPPLCPRNVVRVPQKPRVRRKPRAAPVVALKPIKIECVAVDEQHLAGVPLRMLGRHQCRFAVNDAAIGEDHLFCGLPATGSWCDHHKRRVMK